MDLQQKYQSLQDSLRPLGRLAVAFSGGVDSSFLLAAAAQTLGPQNVLACIGISPSLSQHQLDLARQTAGQIGTKLLEIPLEELQNPDYQANKADRCFHCKSHQFSRIRQIALENGFEHTACGSNHDDRSDYRPGSRAVEALGILTPLADARLNKDNIRKLSRTLDLQTADLPASPCLASRIAYGIEITESRLNQIENAENVLRSLGFKEFRVRHHGSIARIEVPAEAIPKAASESVRKKLTSKLRTLGFQYVTLDLQGFRSGSLNETLPEAGKK